jgi:ferredoxin
MPTVTLIVNGASRAVDAWDPEMPLLYALRNDMGLHAAKFGCGLGQCGACTVLVDDAPARSCTVRLKDAAGRRVVTAEGLGSPERPQRAAARRPAAAAWYEETTFDRARVTSVDWGSYRLPRFPQVPRLEIALLDRPDQPPLGAGEAASSPVPAALANAVFDATGVRLRSVPFSSDKLKSLLA